MRRATLAVAVVLIFAGAPALGGCSSSADTPAPSPAQSLAADDGGAQPAAYQSALDALAGKCTQNEVQLAAMGDASYQQLAKAGITDETRLSVLQHVAASIPAASPKLDCVQQMAAYVTLREG